MLTHRWGNRTITAAGGVLLGLYPLLTGFTTNLSFFLVVSLIGGFAWSLVGAAIGNYLLENVPNTDRPAYLAWYNLALNAAVLVGAMLGPLLAQQFGLVAALVISGIARALAAIVIWILR